MIPVITDETVEQISILSKLYLREEEKEQAKKDLVEMLGYFDALGELDTEGVEPMCHIHPVSNRFREDVVTSKEERDRILANAPEERNGAFVVPKTFA